MKKSKPNDEKVLSKAVNVKNPKRNFKMPTLEQFMELITDENKLLATTPSSYNAYRKYNKGC